MVATISAAGERLQAEIVDLDLKKSSESTSKDNIGDDAFILQNVDGDHEEHRMLIYEPIEGIPIGLEPLLDVTSISVTPGFPMSASLDAVINRHYNILNQGGQKIFHAGEKISLFADYCCNGHRRFQLHFFNARGATVMTVTQKCSCILLLACGECYGTDVHVALANGERIGRIQQRCNCWWPKYEILDSRGEALMSVEGPAGGVCTQLCGRKFRIAFSNMTYGKHIQSVATVDKRKINLPEDLSVQNKSLLLATLFLIELCYFQSSRTYAKALILLALLFAGLLVWRLLLI